MSKKPPFHTTFVDRDDIQIAIFCALGIEADAVSYIFDEIYEPKNLLWRKETGDFNSYTVGRIQQHQAILVYLPQIGKLNATIAACGAKATFRNIEIGLAVGICGGAPWLPGGAGEPLHLGDVVVSTQVLQADFGREYVNRFVMKENNEGNLGQPPAIVQSFLTKLQGKHELSKIGEATIEYVSALLQTSLIGRPDVKTDILYDAQYLHKHRGDCDCECQYELSACEQAGSLTCHEAGCVVVGVRQRSRINPKVFFGKVSSTDTVKRNGITRDQIVREHNVLAFEMEGAGLWKILPTIVIKSLCDYADSHKNKNWQPYAALTAAAACRSILEQWQSSGSINRTLAIDIFNVDPDLREKYLQSLSFMQQTTRLASIEPPHPQTCDWIFETEQFSSWLDETAIDSHHRVLWIKGKIGCGKSTILKHIYHNCSRYFAGHTAVTYFFNARGTELEKTRLGMLRSLLHQILAAHSDLLARFIKGYSEQNDITQYKWSYEELQSFMLLCAQQGWLYPTVILIDALDECPEAEARELVRFCDNLASNAIANNISVYICFSMRHFPNINNRWCVQLNIDNREEHTVALQRYLTHHLNLNDASLITKVLHKCQHVFLWAKLTSERLNTLNDEGVVDLKTMEEQLELVPHHLEDVFELLLRGPHNVPIVKTILLFRLVLYAAQPLEPKQLCMLVVAGTDASQSESWTDKDLTSDRISRFISTASKGLVEIVGDIPITQFVHESVRNYLLSFPGLPGIQSSFKDESQNHAAIVRCCLTSLAAQDRPHCDVEVSRYQNIEYALKHIWLHLQRLLHLAEYSVLLEQYLEIVISYLWYYQGEADGRNGFYDPMLVALWTSVHSGLWPKISNRPLEYLLDSYSFQCDIRDPALPWLKRALSFAVYSRAGTEVLRAILRSVASTSSADIVDMIQHLLLHIGIQRYNPTRISISDDGIDIRISEPMEHDSPDPANIQHCDGFIELIVDEYIDQVKQHNSSIEAQLLALTIDMGYESCLSKLINFGVDPNIRIRDNETALCMTMRKANWHIYKQAPDDPVGHTKAKTKQHLITEILIKHHADPNTQDQEGIPILFYAIVHKNQDLIKLLIDSGANAAVLIRGVSAVHIMAQVGFSQALQLFDIRKLCHQPADGNGRTPIHIAVTFGHALFIEELLLLQPSEHDQSSDRLDAESIHEIPEVDKSKNQTSSVLNIQDWNGQTALHYSISILINQPASSDLEIVPLLLRAGADPNIKDASAKTCLDLSKDWGVSGDKKRPLFSPPLRNLQDFSIEPIEKVAPSRPGSLSNFRLVLDEILTDAGARPGARRTTRSAMKRPGKNFQSVTKNPRAKSNLPPSSKGSTTVHSVGESYRKAAADCIAAVEKIVKRCRQGNLHYQDSHFDIEHDLKINHHQRRDYLEGLDYISERDRKSPSNSPQSVKHVHQVFDKPEFYIDDPTALDLRQGKDGDCWFLAALRVLGNKPGLIPRICVARDEQAGVYGFVFHRDGQWIYTIVDDKLYLSTPEWDESLHEEIKRRCIANGADPEEEYQKVFQAGRRALYFTQCTVENGIWAPLLEKAFAKVHGNWTNDEWGLSGEVIEDLTGGVTTELFVGDILDLDRFWTEELLKVNEEFLFSCGTGRFDDVQWDGERTDRKFIRSSHACSIIAAREHDGRRLLKVSIPRADIGWTGRGRSDGISGRAAEWKEDSDFRFGDDGVCWISYFDLLKMYPFFDRTRLFDDSWKVTQQWVSLQVPWYTQYHITKFTFSLTEEGPIVIVLSQLDERYWSALKGQFAFSLHFRINKAGEDNYIVRSYGNYWMRRSVSTEITLEPGVYDVRMRITATKHQHPHQVNTVIGENRMADQAKLLQVALSYDLAHAKGLMIETEGVGQTKVDPWNAVCVVGLRLFTKNGEAKVRVSESTADESEDNDTVKNEADTLHSAPLDVDDQIKSTGDAIGSSIAENDAARDTGSENKQAPRRAKNRDRWRGHRQGRGRESERKE